MTATYRTIVATFALAVLLLVTAGLTATAAGPDAAGLPLPYGLEAMERLDLLPYMAANGTLTKQFISYDTCARNGSTPLNFKRYEENGEWVFFDEIGPGCLYRQQMNVFFSWSKFPNDKARIRLYFDDDPKPRIDMTFAQFFGKDGNYSSSLHAAPGLFRRARTSQTQGQAWQAKAGQEPHVCQPLLSVPLPEAAEDHGLGGRRNATLRLQLVSIHLPEISRRHGGEDLEAAQVDSPLVRKLWQNMGQDPKPAASAKAIVQAAKVPRGGKAVLLDLPGSGNLASLRLTMTPWNKELFDKAILRVTWDDQKIRLSRCPSAASSAAAATRSAPRTCPASHSRRYCSASTPKPGSFTAIGPCPSGRGPRSNC